MLHLVTGGAGFLGCEVARALHARGEKVRILDTLAPPPLPSGIEVIRGDILDSVSLEQAMQGVGVVHHNAALVPVTKAGPRFWQVNAEGTQHALAAAARSGVGFFIYVSSSAVFGVPQACPITDDTPPCPVEAYGRSKLQGERHVEEFARNGLRCAIVRPRTIVGPGRLGIFKILYEWIREGRRIYLIGGGDNRFQFVHAQDVVGFILLLAERRKSGSYNIGAEEFGTLRGDLSALIRHAGTSSRVTGTPAGLTVAALRILNRLRLSPLGPYHYLVYPRPFYFDISRPMRELGWKPRFSNVESLVASYDWFLRHGDELSSGGMSSTHRRPVRQGLLRFLKRLS